MCIDKRNTQPTTNLKVKIAFVSRRKNITFDIKMLTCAYFVPEVSIFSLILFCRLCRTFAPRNPNI